MVVNKAAFEAPKQAGFNNWTDMTLYTEFPDDEYHTLATRWSKEEDLW